MPAFKVATTKQCHKCKGGGKVSMFPGTGSYAQRTCDCCHGSGYLIDKFYDLSEAVYTAINPDGNSVYSIARPNNCSCNTATCNSKCKDK